MVKNLVDLFTELSREIAKHELGFDNDELEIKGKERILSRYVAKLRRKGFDVLLRKYPEDVDSDPCVTAYGANWNPSILILDYGGELSKLGLEKVNKRLISNVEALQKKDWNCLRELYKLIFLLKGPFVQQVDDLQHNFLNTVSEYSINSVAPFPSVQDEQVGSEIESSKSVFIENSLNIFDSGCQLLDSLSNKSLVTLAKQSTKYLMSSSTSRLVNLPYSSASSDYLLKKKPCSNCSFLRVASSIYTSDYSLWDNFVQKPISSKSKSTASSSGDENYYARRNAAQIKNKCEIFNVHNPDLINQLDNYWTKIYDSEGAEKKELKDKYMNDEITGNQGLYLYPILHEKCLQTKNYESCFGRKTESKRKNDRQGSKNSFFESSVTLILALWEQEHRLMYAYDPQFNFKPSKLRVMELDQYLRDVQFLLIGVSTDTFQIDKEGVAFNMKYGTCLEGVTPNTLLGFSKEFLEIGACYVQLSRKTQENLKKQMVSGVKYCRIIHKVFWMSIFDYLCRHSEYVLKIPLDLGLLEFKAYVKNLYPIIIAVTEVCKASSPDGSLPQGGQLLTYLLQATQKITNKSVLAVFFGFLKCCCEAYLLQLLQSWMFQGHLDRDHRDFFVEHRPKNPRCKDRSYYLSFYMFHDRIPSFLKGLEHHIFNCGKTIHLLKLIQPDSKLCRLLETRAYPKMKLCLSMRELIEQKESFEEYASGVSKICGKFASIISLRLEEKDREYFYEKYVIKVKKEQQAEKELKKKKEIQIVRLKREEQKKWLKEQIEQAAEEKRRKQEEEEMHSKLFVEQIRRIAEEERRMVEEEKRNITMFYQELMDQAENRKARAISWKQRAEELNKKNILLRNFKSTDDIGTETKGQDKLGVSKTCDNDLVSENHPTKDKEGNVICPTTETVDMKSLDVVNSNLSEENGDLQIEDLENENVSLEEKLDNRVEIVVPINPNPESDKAVQEICISDLSSHVSMEESDETPSMMSTRSGQRDWCKSRTHVKISFPVDDKSGDDRKTASNSIIITESKSSSTEIYIATSSRSECEANINRQKMTASHFVVGGVVETCDTPKGTEPEGNTQKNKKLRVRETGIMTECEPRGVKAEPDAKVEARRNKEKVLACEFELTKKPDKPEKWGKRKTNRGVGTEEENMTMVPGIATEPEGGATQVRSQPPPPERETEAQRNKRRVLSSEYDLHEEPPKSDPKLYVSQSSPVEPEAPHDAKIQAGVSVNRDAFSETCVGSKLSSKAVALKNKQKVMEMEYGIKDRSGTDVRDVKDVKSEEAEVKEKKAEEAPEPEEGDFDFDDLPQTSFAEKALKIFNKQRISPDEWKFFVLKENPSRGTLRAAVPWMNEGEVQVLFEQQERRPTGSSLPPGPTGEEEDFSDLDITKFVNCIRKSVLIPLQIQEGIANEALFNHLLKEERLLTHFDSLRNYFFLNDGEFSRRLTQNIFATLAQCTDPAQFFKRSTLNRIVYEALNYTIHSNEPNTKNVSFEIVEMPDFLAHSSHDVLSPFDLSYHVRWPLNIILTDRALAKYKLVFHFLLKLKRINWTLNENFNVLNYSYRDKSVAGRKLLNSTDYHKIHLYRHAMGQFLRTLENYISSCSLHFSWLNFQKDIETAENLDHLYDKHVRYLKEVLKRCFLTKDSEELLGYIHSLIELGLKFHYATKTGSWVLVKGSYKHSKFEVLRTAFNEFCGLTKDFIKELRKKISTCHDLKPHEVLLEKFDIILR